MLVLSRQKNEKLLIILDGVVLAEIEPVDIRGDKVRLGVTAPKHVQVHRKEVWEKVQQEKANADKLRLIAPMADTR
mgnify:CR=1 FL=1